MAWSHVLLAALIVVPSSILGHPSAIGPADSVNLNLDTSPHLAFPPVRQQRHAFTTADQELLNNSARASYPRSNRLQFDVKIPENPQNPVLAWENRPLAVPQSLGESWELQKRQQVISQSDAPFPPSKWVDVNNLTTIALIAQAAIARMQTWYEDGVYQWTGWWQVPVLGIAYANLDLALGNRVNELLIKDLLIRNDDLGWMIDKYIDDQSWWAMFALRGHQAYPNQTWFEMVEAINYNNTLYWDDSCGGGVLWLTYRPLIKNTITNGLYFSILTRLYRLTGNPTYYQHAMNTLNWWLGWAFDTETGGVLDTITAPECTAEGEGWWTYNSGAFLFGLADLYYATNDTKILDLGRSIAYSGMTDFTNPATGVMEESCEDDPQPSPELPPGCQQDATVFKGIFLLGMAELYLARPDENMYNFINTQFLTNVVNNVDPSWLFGVWWGGPWNETTAGPKSQINVICAISAAALVNADFISKTSGGNAQIPNMLQVGVPTNTTRDESAGTIRGGGMGANSSAGRIFNGSHAALFTLILMGLATILL